MNRPPGISRVSSCRPEAGVAKVIADKSEHQLDRARRHKWLLAHIRSSRADFTREFESRRRLLATLKPLAPSDPFVADIEAAWQRLSADYHKFRNVNHSPARKWRHGR
ncbi:MULTISPECIES: hypothetical protein [Rhizobium]|uniref:hypothetical protein n=1 Tax=Rhizobium TaxID=379 RepID=UPI0010314D4D|nr:MULTISPECIES: hypothetical protein [Rhizobium]TBB97705.1 hypothetical protein ELH39_10840 [Rhizobium ruizarguesonis]